MFGNDIGPFGRSGKFAENLHSMLVFNSAVFELIDWMEDVEAGLKDPTLPAEVKAQVFVDYSEIKKRFNELSGSIANV